MTTIFVNTDTAVKINKPQFNELISLQTSQGNWNATSRNLIEKFFAKPLPKGSSDDVLCTIAALCVLESFFIDKQSQWALIAQKAKAFLKNLKIDVDNEVDKLAELLD